MKISPDMLYSIMRKFPGEILLDPEDYERFVLAKVYKRTDGYVHIVLNGKHELLHHAVTNFKHVQLDHKNRIRWDCRKENLRPATNSQNAHSVGIPAHNTSGFKGVTFCKCTNNWRAQITIKGKTVILGKFSTPERASEIYKKKAKELHGEFAHE